MKKLEEGAGEWRSLGAGAVVAFAAFLEEIRASSSDSSRNRGVTRPGAARTRAFLRLTFPSLNCRFPLHSDYKLERINASFRFTTMILISIGNSIRDNDVFYF